MSQILIGINPISAPNGGDARVMDVEAGSLIVIAAQVGTAQNHRIRAGGWRHARQA
jgi:hypothetical protein